MDNQDFDQQLRNIYDNSHLPFDDQLWDKMHRRLHDNRKSKKIVLWQKKIPLYYKFFIAIASATIGFVFYVSLIGERDKEKSNFQVNNRLNVTPSTIIDSSSQKNALLGRMNVMSIPPKIIGFKKSKESESSMAILNDDTLLKSTIELTPLSAQQIFDSLVSQKNIEGDRGDALVNIEDIKFANPSLDHNVSKKPVYFDVLGGYNVNNIKNSFSLGINIKRDLPKKLRFDASLSLVGGYNRTFEQFERGITPAGVDTTLSKSALSNVFYLQAAPSLSYQLFDNLYTGLGMDAQRLVSANNQSIVYDSVGNIIGSQPIWDFGITFKMDYQISNKINAGVIYRESLGGVNSIKSPSISRNYILMQMSYTIF